MIGLNKTLQIQESNLISLWDMTAVVKGVCVLWEVPGSSPNSVNYIYQWKKNTA